ncbi:MAG: S1C family serine protease [Planctomycetota bacterium]
MRTLCCIGLVFISGFVIKAQGADFQEAFQKADRALVSCRLSDTAQSKSNPTAIHTPKKPRYRYGFAVANNLVLTMPIPIDDAPVNLIMPDGKNVTGQIVVSDGVTNMAIVQVDNVDLEPLVISETEPAPGKPVVVPHRVDQRELVIDSMMVSSRLMTDDQKLGRTQRLSGQAYDANLLGAPILNDHGELVGVYGMVVPRQTQGSQQPHWRAFHQSKPEFKGLFIPSQPPHPIVIQTSIVRRLLADATNHAGSQDGPRRLARGRAGIELAGTDQALVLRVLTGSAAAEAGVQVNDLVLEINDQRCLSASDAIALVNEHRAGETVRFKLKRGHIHQTAELTLGEIPNPSERWQVTTFKNEPDEVAFSNLYVLRDGKLVQLDGKPTVDSPIISIPGGSPPNQPLQTPAYSLAAPLATIPQVRVQRSTLEDSVRRIEEMNKQMSDSLAALQEEIAKIRQHNATNRGSD